MPSRSRTFSLPFSVGRVVFFWLQDAAVPAARVRLSLRAAIVAKLQEDAALIALFAPEAVVVAYRPTRRFIQLPLITFFDTGTKADDSVPLWDRSIQIDVWTHGDLDLAEAIAARVADLLDHQPLGPSTSGVFTGDTGRVDYLSLEADHNATEEEADLTRVTLLFKAILYQYA